MRYAILLAALFLLNASIVAPAQRRRTIRVYYANTKFDPGMSDCSKVFPVKRSIPATASVAGAALEQLFNGPTRREKARGYFSPFSSRTKAILLGVRIAGGTAYVNLKDFTRTLPNTSASCGSAEFVAEMETTLKQFPSIKKVIFAIEGKPQDFYDWIQTGCDEDTNDCDEAPFKRMPKGRRGRR